MEPDTILMRLWVIVFFTILIIGISESWIRRWKVNHKKNRRI